MNIAALLSLLLGLVLSPLMLGVINKTKAFFAGRRGPLVLQIYWDLWKLLHKGAVYSRTTSWVFKAGPIIWLAAAMAALLIVPFGHGRAIVSFEGDLVLLAYLFGLMRLFIVLAGLDTGSSLEGMGASREVQFSALAEPALLLSLAALARLTGSLSLTGIYVTLSPQTLAIAGPAMILIAGALLIVFLAENSRIPVDDPDTHLELTMIHEVMVLDTSGPDLAFILYGSAVKMWILGSLLMGVLLPVRTGHALLDVVVMTGEMFVLAVATGVIESTMARLRMGRVPQLLGAGSALAMLALILVLR